eukprot:TRINITY_DN3349_c0_g1_i4.p3 TRINITY_DN3349_c0_g1~~TRINITY_DN3349_c0_g1_i4.p3  ORF type:complete len:240 (+),score=89.92 TRINITY_DN3349_c0_g1_i4:147-866(+)
MTGAHRPTWKAAIGSSEQGGNIQYIPTRQYSARDVPSHLNLKLRTSGQGTVEEAQRIDFKQELLERERQARIKKGEPETFEEEPLPIEEPEDEYTLDPYLNEALAKGKRLKSEEQNPFPQDEDEDLSGADEEFEGKEASEDDDDAELMREFEKIKKEREEEQKRKEMERLEEQKEKQRKDIMSGNPIYNSTSYSLKKRWTEDTVFKNQARVLPKDKGNRFVNDIIRSDFHRKFLAKYIQ